MPPPFHHLGHGAAPWPPEGHLVTPAVPPQPPGMPMPPLPDTLESPASPKVLRLLHRCFGCPALYDMLPSSAQGEIF